MLKLEHISKTYPGVVALDDVSLEFEQGEVHALLGENGAGKSTLIKIIAGAIEPDAGGVIDFDGKKFTHMTPALSAQNGVAVIYQDINLVTPMTVAENIFMGRKMGKVYSKRRLNALARELFAEYGFNMDPSMKVSRLSPANQQLVEIARAISNNAKIMIMDEPTAPLAAHEVELLFSINSALAEKYRGELRIKVPGVKQMVVNLSGGNQQKVALAKALAADPDIIIFDEPTKGIDVGAKQEIYQLMNDLVESGKAIIMVLLETTLPFWVVWPVCIVLGFLMGTLNGPYRFQAQAVSACRDDSHKRGVQGHCLYDNLIEVLLRYAGRLPCALQDETTRSPAGRLPRNSRRRRHLDSVEQDPLRPRRAGRRRQQGVRKALRNPLGPGSDPLLCADRRHFCHCHPGHARPAEPDLRHYRPGY